MAKNPIFPLYYNDILGSTKTWTDEEFGAYMRLLIHQWDHNELPKDYQRLTRIATSLDTNWSMLKNKFEETETGLQNAVLEGIRHKRLKFSEKQKENIKNRYQKSTKLSTKNLPLENEIENENEIEIENIKERKISKIFVPPTLDEARDYFLELNQSETEARLFHNFYLSKKWKVGKNTMVDWKAAARGWALRKELGSTHAKTTQTKKQEERYGSLADLAPERAARLREEKRLQELKLAQ
jgi:uncharacterized protein YdaU (DUF1376 family)